jgi:NAD(P)-dependent dehydrogenase (short-subunit alcohol dehydrogenase family)
MTFNPMNLNGKMILVTGASSGIGKVTAQIISKLGGKVILLARNERRLKQVLMTLSGQGHGFYPFDLTATDEIPSLMKKVAREHENLTGIFHSAGIGGTMPVTIFKKKYIDSVLDISVKAALMLTRGFCQKGVQKQGVKSSLVFMSSAAGLCGVGGMSIYSASKAAVDGAVRSLACELASRGIRVNSIAAGAVRTEMHEDTVGKLNEQAMKDYEHRHLLGFGNPEDVAYAAAFLLSDAASWITGTTMIVDGGYCCP